MSVQSNAKQGSISKKINGKVKIPIYNQKIFNSPTEHMEICQDSARLIGHVTVNTEYDSEFWSIRNVYLVSEKPNK
jgi:hypothetical protein